MTTQPPPAIPPWTEAALTDCPALLPISAASIAVSLLLIGASVATFINPPPPKPYTACVAGHIWHIDGQGVPSESKAAC